MCFFLATLYLLYTIYIYSKRKIIFFFIYTYVHSVHNHSIDLLMVHYENYIYEIQIKLPFTKRLGYIYILVELNLRKVEPNER